MSIIDSIEKITPAIFAKQDYETIYHYTNPVGLLGILNTKKIWLTEYSYLNDPDEIQHGINKCHVKVLEILVEIMNRERSFDSFKYKMLNIVSEKLNLDEYLNEKYIFISSFSKYDDLLSQWKGYSNNGSGYSIGFSIDKLRERKILLGKVIYNDEAKRAIAKLFIDGFLDDEETYHKIGEDKFISGVIETIRLISCFFKSDFFHEEEEWRFVQYLDNKEKERIHYRTSQYGLTPYIEIDVDDAIQKIVVGPKLDFVLNRKVLSLKISRDDIVQSKSKIR
jgi:hypothetical protein